MPLTSMSAELQTLCRRYHALPLALDDQTLTVAVSGAAGAEMLTALRFASNRRVLVEQWPAARFEQRINQPESAGSHAASDADTEAADAIDGDERADAPVVQLINQTLRLAIQRRASDIHFEPVRPDYRIRLRIDGVLQTVSAPPAELALQINARLKIMAGLNIAERRLPQDGQFSLTLDRQPYSLRIATLPVHFGEKIVLRILQTRQQELRLENLGLPEPALRHLRRILSLPQGMILVTGPTGSGKTVTLYSAIRWLNDITRNICSVEDPIEIPLDGINQTAINPKADLTFARILRALLRQDPDVIMIGEIRDAETAEIAVKAAQTGHLVLSTLHTNSAAETLTRLANLGIPGYLLASALKLVIAQRLVRRLCPHCRQPDETPPLLPAELWRGPLTSWRAQGCQHCFSGYYGRTAIYHLMPVTPPLQQALAENLTAAACGGVIPRTSLFHAGLELVNRGVTSLAELYRVTGQLPLDE
ncbi:type II secretion system protein GspE [Affinibrenneria salicis]|uniref:Type II secretion system protein GspE n=1 Tax=Affinibrenneria salicis TaxID=2590031 RepID=A0A5J5G5U9_9GAMM|nr:type II secretion system protein GspE [Affinibrenneria salicis]KAA9002586.1 type II secretion system protein GspE [Affinibrenneria salicis]KAA9003126.1 type II secretion system protein GspE [Affinibrenneria salicis]